MCSGMQNLVEISPMDKIVRSVEHRPKLWTNVCEPYDFSVLPPADNHCAWLYRDLIQALPKAPVMQDPTRVWRDLYSSADLDHC